MRRAGFYDLAMNGHARILVVVDNEQRLTSVLANGLRSQGYQVRSATDGVAGFEAFIDWDPDLVITDLGVPKFDGLELCRRMRANSELPIIMLSASTEPRTKVTALDLGADYFVTKPFGIDELFARVRALLRRSNVHTVGPTMHTIFDSGDFHVELETHQIYLRGKQIRLTPKEFDLMVYFIRHSGNVLRHRTLLSALWGANYVEQIQYLRVFVSSLRKKIETDPARPDYILTEPWIGYRFESCPSVRVSALQNNVTMISSPLL